MLKSQQILENRYKITKQLGRNSKVRQIWLGEDLTRMDLVSIRLLAFSPQMGWDNCKLWQQQAKIFCLLNHPRIPNYRDYFVIDQTTADGLTWFALVEDYLSGFSVQDLLAQHISLTEPEIRSLAMQVLSILQYLHQCKPPVFHRNIQPSNLIQGQDGQIYLIGLDLVQNQPSKDNLHVTVGGSNAYTPLEQFKGQTIPASDIYALGVTLIHLLTGISPLPDQNSRIIISDKVDISPSLRQWLNKSTAPNVEQRFQSASEALTALDEPNLVNHDLNYNQPPDTLIKLTQTPTELTIFFPPEGYRKLSKIIDPDLWLVERRIINRILGDLTIISPLSMVIILISIFFISLMIGFHLLLLLIIIIKLLIVYNESINISINSQEFNLVRQGLSFVYGRKKIYVREITALKMKKKVWIHEIILQTETDQFLIGHALKENECQWLITSINNWLFK